MTKERRLKQLNPKILFLIDGLGAALSVLLLGFVLVRYESIFGIPTSALYFLATLPFVFMFYDLFSFFNANDKAGFHLKTIAFLNLMYCIVSLITAYYHSDSITYFGWFYIIFEIVILLFLSSVECKVGKNINRKNATKH
ncbi:hypothetical protein [Brumimicrobium aurantiacum]|uniref:Uncharacterized protein n=1 Tax=Brumimicrobium aurantiacum TaxID=1737063 RepID=A0A3E1EV24_9FLAO|nr:hypothetical protein [Brumimicrobium aurantiacum]RFC53362.1 hypothetical protein DXU93_13090 [Brumimicrobium aurantiacum]